MKIEVKDLSFSYHNNVVFDTVSFSAKDGDFICILGKNGAGKTTLLNCICRLLKAKSGDILFEQKSIRSFDNKEFARLVSFVPQNYNPVYECTVEDFLYMGRNPYKTLFSSFSQEDKSIVEKVMKEFSMKDFSKRSMSQLSGGERKKILLMRTLVQQTKVIILDEPTNQLDFGMQMQFMDILKRLTDTGKIIIMTTHLPDNAINYSSKTIIMADKRAQVYNTLELNVGKLEKLYSVEMEILEGKKINKMACVAIEKIDNDNL